MVGLWRILLLAGGAAAIGLAAFLFAGSVGQPAIAQPPAAAPVAAAGRYQLASFVIQEVKTPGAYVLDTQTGEVFQVLGQSQPVLVGSVVRPRPKD